MLYTVLRGSVILSGGALVTILGALVICGTETPLG